MHLPQLMTLLQEELTRPLPGTAFQLRMSSLRRIRELMKFRNPSDARASSVLILLYPGAPNDDVSLVLIRRPEYDGVHSGQISLPGGRKEPSDSDHSATALRETQEEIGVDPALVTIIGKLSELYIPPSNYLVHPFVGYCLQRPVFTPDPNEVDTILEADLGELINDRNIRKQKIILRNGFSISAPCYDLNGAMVWGATAMILSEFREVVRRSAAWPVISRNG